jgi:acetolactate synthase-1/2/3 large subunit
MAQMIHGGRLVARALKAEQVECLFTLCGGHIQAIYDGCLDEGIRVVDTRHEQSAGHAADGWARATGRPGVCAVTAGPGVTDVVTALANAQRAGVPLVCFGGAGPRVFNHMGSLQDMDHLELMRPVTKWARAITETRRLAEYVSIAYRKATTGVPGPVFLEVPIDLLMEFVDESLSRCRRTTAPPAHRARSALSRRSCRAALRAAEQPVAIVGSQMRWSRDPKDTIAAAPRDRHAVFS